jgi:hypothetical protein
MGFSSFSRRGTALFGKTSFPWKGDRVRTNQTTGLPATVSKASRLTLFRNRPDFSAAVNLPEEVSALY